MAAALALVKAGIGGLQLIGAARKKQQAEAVAPAFSDPREIELLNQLRREQARFRTGAAFQTAERQIRQQAAAAGQNITRLSGGAGGQAIAGLQRTARGTGRALGDISQASLQQQAQLRQLEQQQLTRVTQRDLELRLLRSRQLLGEAARQKSSGQQNLGTLGGLFAGGGGQNGGGGQEGFLGKLRTIFGKTESSQAFNPG